MKSNDLENGESITVHFFSTSLKDSTMCRVFFSGSGMTSHIFCIVADAKIDDLIIKINKKESTMWDNIADSIWEPYDNGWQEK